MFNTDVYASLFNKLTENEQRVLLSIRGQKITPPSSSKIVPHKIAPPGKMPQTNSPWFSVTVRVRVGGNLPGSNFPRGVILVLFQQEKQFWQQWICFCLKTGKLFFAEVLF